MRRRILTTALAGILAVAGLAGCQSNVGVAARVGGQRITESSVNSYLAQSGIDKTLASQASAQGQSISAPRTQVLQTLIQEQIFRKALAEQGIHPSASDLANVHDQAAASVMQTQLTGKELDTALDKRLPAFGIKSSFRPTLLRTQQLEYLFLKKVGNKAQTELAKANIPVSVSPRYGAWDAKTLSLGAAAALPSFVTPQPTPGAGS